jgi:hypothetical protein
MRDLLRTISRGRGTGVVCAILAEIDGIAAEKIHSLMLSEQ